MKALRHFFTMVACAIMVNTSAQYEAECAVLEAWTLYPAETYADPTSPQSRVLLCDVIGTPNPLANLLVGFSYIGNSVLSSIQDGFGQGIMWVQETGINDTNVYCYWPTDTLSPGDTLYFRKYVIGGTNVMALGDPSHPSFVCRYWSDVWMYVVPDITTGTVDHHGLPSGIRLRADHLAVTITSDSPENFSVFDTQGNLIREGMVSGEVHIRMQSAGVYILKTNHGSKRFFVSD